jgi:ribonuclease HI
MHNIEIYIDGASKGNPGPAGIGVIICRNKQVIDNISFYIGRCTNNVAEYTALIRGLKRALAFGLSRITINTDSQLLYRQIKGEYRIKHPNIIKLYNQAIRLLSEFDRYEIKHILRKDNRGADRLANQAIKSSLRG